METQLNGNFGLFEIDKVIMRRNFFELKFTNDKRCFFGCYLNSFIDEDGTSKRLLDLDSGDKIWIDISAHTADKSLYLKPTRDKKNVT
jgi:hypothetical protein